MSTNTSSSGHADDFDACCESGFYRRHHATVASGSNRAGAIGTSNPSNVSTGASSAGAGGSGGTASGAGSYDEVRPAYQFGHRAAASPSYRGRAFEDVEVDLRREYGDESKFEKARDYVRESFEWKTMLAGVAGAAGAWWAGRKVYDAIKDMNEEDEQDVRTYYDTHSASRTGLPYSRARSGYALGYAAARNPDYTGRSFEQVEPHLRTGYAGAAGQHSDAVTDFARRGYERAGARSATGRGSV